MLCSIVFLCSEIFFVQRWLNKNLSHWPRLTHFHTSDGIRPMSMNHLNWENVDAGSSFLTRGGGRGEKSGLVIVYIWKKIKYLNFRAPLEYPCAKIGLFRATLIFAKYENKGQKLKELRCVHCLLKKTHSVSDLWSFDALEIASQTFSLHPDQMGNTKFLDTRAQRSLAVFRMLLWIIICLFLWFS